MEDSGLPDLGGKAIVRRSIDHENEVIVARAEFGELFKAYAAHAERWEEVPDGLSEVMVRQGLGALALHLSNRPVDETSAWTINIKQPLMNVFFAGDASKHAVVGRVFLDNVKEAPISQLFVEIQRRGRSPYRSVVEVDGIDIHQIFERFFAQSEQLDTRFFEVTDSDFAMIQALPEFNGAWLRQLDRESALKYLDTPLKTLDEQVFQFHCGCDVGRMTELLNTMYSGKLNELFLDENRVEVVCPRCGHKWWLKRTDFESGGRN